MRQHVFLVLGLLATFGCRGTPYLESEAEDVLAFVDVNVVPMNREVILPHQTVIVRGGRIAEIGPVDETVVPTDSKRIDGEGAYLMPGLADMHVHPGDPQELVVYVANGVTTIRNMWGFPDEHLVWRSQVQRGEIVGPTIYTAGPILDGNPPAFPGSEVVESPEEAQRAVSDHRAAGYDFIKVLSNVKPDVYDAITAAAAAQRIRVVGHVPLSIDLDHALASGIASIEHLTGYELALQSADSPVVDRSEMRASLHAWQFFDESRLGEVVEKTRQAGVWNCPTLEALRAYLPENMELLDANGGRKYLSPSMREWWDKALSSPNREDNIALFRMSIEPRGKVVQALNAGGARILLGTDAPNTGVVPGFSAHRELRNLVDAGLTPYEAIRSGTFDAAEFLGAQDEFGTVSVGRRADLILVKGNPLEEIENTFSIVGVMLRGGWLPRAKLDAMLDGVATS